MNSYNELTEEEAAEYGFQSLDEYRQWKHSWEEACIYVTIEEEKNRKLTSCLYTDGDGGVIQFKSWCELYPSGMEIALKGCRYCNIDYGMMEDIHTKLEKDDCYVG